MKTSILKLGAIAICISLTALSCKKETSESDLTPQEEEQTSVASSQAEAETEMVFNDVFDNVIGVNSEVGFEGIGVFGRTTGTTDTQGILGCYVVTVTRLVTGQAFPLRITVDFGAGCTGRDGRTRSGKIITEYSGRLIVPGKTSVTTLENYKVDSISIEGTLKIKNTSTASMRQFTAEVVNAKLARANGDYIKRNSLRIITQVEGIGTPEFAKDDAFSITGQASGEVKIGNLITIWESQISEALLKRFSCQWISKGVVKINRGQSGNTQWTGTLNYGNGQCDNKGILTVNGIDHQITFH